MTGVQTCALPILKVVSSLNKDVKELKSKSEERSEQKEAEEKAEKKYSLEDMNKKLDKILKQVGDAKKDDGGFIGAAMKLFFGVEGAAIVAEIAEIGTVVVPAILAVATWAAEIGAIYHMMKKVFGDGDMEDAAKAGDRETVEKLMRKKVDREKMDIEGDTGDTLYATAEDQEKEVQKRVDKYMDENQNAQLKALKKAATNPSEMGWDRLKEDLQKWCKDQNFDSKTTKAWMDEYDRRRSQKDIWGSSGVAPKIDVFIQMIAPQVTATLNAQGITLPKITPPQVTPDKSSSTGERTSLGGEITINGKSYAAENSDLSKLSFNDVKEKIKNIEVGKGNKGQGPYDTTADWIPSPKPITQMTLKEVMDYQKNTLGPEFKKRHPGHPASSGLGAYAFEGTTLAESVKRMKLDLNQKFTPELQDRIAEELFNLQQKSGNLGTTWGYFSQTSAAGRKMMADINARAGNKPGTASPAMPKEAQGYSDELLQQIGEKGGLTTASLAAQQATPQQIDEIHNAIRSHAALTLQTQQLIVKIANSQHATVAKAAEGGAAKGAAAANRGSGAPIPTPTAKNPDASLHA